MRSSPRFKRSLPLLALLLSVACGSGGSYTSPPSDGGTCSDTWTSYGNAFFSNECAPCHGQFGSQPSVQASASAIASQVSSGRMPEGSNLSSTEKTRLLAWLACGAQ